MEQRERDESSSKLEEALRELTGAETTGKIEEYENEREGADVDSETACTVSYTHLTLPTTSRV